MNTIDNHQNMLARALESMRSAVEAYERQAGASEPNSLAEAADRVIEALCWSTALELTGDLVSVPEGLAEALRRAGRRVLLSPPQAQEGSDEADALALALPLARDGLRALSGKPRPQEAVSTASLPAPETLVTFVRGALDGLASAELAIRIRRSTAASRELSWLRRRIEAGASQDVEPQRYAAAAADALLDPAQGRLVGRLGPEALAHVELYAFEEGPEGGPGSEGLEGGPGSEGLEGGPGSEGLEGGPGGRLAAYAAESKPLHVEANGLVTQAMQPGYWCGRFAGPMPSQVQVRLGDQVEALALTPAQSKRS